MQNNFELPVFILPEPSRWCKRWICMVHLGAVVLLLVSMLPWVWKTVLLLLVVLSYRSISGKYCQQSLPRSIVQVYCNEADEWWLTTADGNIMQARLLPPSFVHARLVILGFKTGPAWWQRCHVILTPETANPDTLRRLRVRLRLPLSSGTGNPE